MTEELKPCPFCGGPAHFYENEVDFVPVWCVGCDECPAGFDACGDTKAEVAALWNHRPVALAERATDTLPRAKPQDAKNGWTLDPSWMKDVRDTLIDVHEANASLEVIEAIALHVEGLRHSPAVKSTQWCSGCSRDVEKACHHFQCPLGPNRSQPATSPAVSDREAAIEECRQLLLTRALWNKSKDEEAALLRAADAIGDLAGRSQPVTASQREIAINLLGWPSPEKAAEALLSKFNVTCKTTEEPRG